MFQKKTAFFARKIISIVFAAFIYWPFSVAQTTFPPSKPKLVVVVTIDQMRSDFLSRYWDYFGDKGFKRLYDAGTVCKNTYNNQLYNSSLTGYANLHTGAYAAVHGVVGPNWFNRLSNTYEKTLQPAKIAGINGPNKLVEFSVQNLPVSTLTDELELATNGASKTYSLSLQNYAAVIGAGHLGDGAYWFNTQTGEWMSSTAYPFAQREWMKEWHSKKLQDEYLNRQWTTQMSIAKYTQSDSDNSSYEIGIGKRQNTFPYNLSELSGEPKYDILQYTPFGNTYLKDFAIAAIVYEKIGKDDTPDLISIGFSTSGMLGNVYGPRAVEIQDIYLRLDKDLAHLLEFLDNFVGQENYLLVLTTDQGAPDVPAYLEKRGMPFGYFNANKAQTLLQSYLKALYGRGDWLVGYQGLQFYLNHQLIDKSKLSIEEMQLKAAQFLAQFNGVASAMPTVAFQKANFTEGKYKRFQNSFHQRRSGDIMVQLEPGWIETGVDKDNPAVYTHTSGYEYNTHVPMLWFGWKTSRKEISDYLEVIDISPTISDVLQIARPNAATGKPIPDLFK